MRCARRILVMRKRCLQHHSKWSSGTTPSKSPASTPKPCKRTQEQELERLSTSFRRSSHVRQSPLKSTSPSCRKTSSTSEASALDLELGTTHLSQLVQFQVLMLRPAAFFSPMKPQKKSSASGVRSTRSKRPREPHPRTRKRKVRRRMVF